MANLRKVFHLPEMNPVRFIDENSPDKGFQTLRPSDWFYNQLQEWNVKENYFQPWTFYDKISIQIQVGGLYFPATGSYVAYITITDKNRKVLARKSASSLNALSGNTITEQGIPYALLTHNFDISFSEFNIYKEDVYFLILEVGYLSGGEYKFDYFYSEPLHIAKEHVRTVIGSYYSDKNIEHVDYTKAPYFQFQIRFPAEMILAEVNNTSAGYDDADMNPRQQANTPYRTIQAILGGNYGMPMYMYDKLNRMLANKFVHIANVRYVKPKDARVETDQKDRRYKLVKGSVLLREYDQTEAARKVSIAPLVLFEIPAYPYLVFNLGMGNDTSGARKNIYTGYEINNQTEENEFIDTVNTYFRVSQGVYGWFYREGNNFVYSNRNDENWNQTQCLIFTKYLNFVHQKYSGFPIPSVKLAMYFSGKRFAVRPLHNYEVFTFGDGVNVTNTGFEYDYVNNGNPTNVTARFWHEDTIDELHTVSKSLIRVDAGAWPLGLKILSLNNTSLDSFDLGAIDNTLETLALYSNLITDVTSFNVKNWLALKIINLDNNRIPTVRVDGIFNEHRALGFTPPVNGFFSQKNQTPVATATGASLAARQYLVNTRNWTVQF